jgi:hypothetical protein
MINYELNLANLIAIVGTFAPIVWNQWRISKKRHEENRQLLLSIKNQYVEVLAKLQHQDDCMDKLREKVDYLNEKFITISAESKVSRELLEILLKGGTFFKRPGE